MLRWLALYQTADGPAACISVNPSAEFLAGHPNAVAPDCSSVIALVPLPDDYDPGAVTIYGNSVNVREPEDPFADYVTGTLDCTIEELFGALEDRGATVKRGLVTSTGEFLPQSND